MRTISILTVFDTEKILGAGTSQDITQPLKVEPGSLYMVANDHDLGGNQASGDLIVEACVGDVLNWRASSLSGNTAEPVHFYGFKAETPGIFEPPHPGTPAKEASPSKSIHCDSIATHWTASVIGAGCSSYRLYFSIRTRNGNGLTVNSYYFWESGAAGESDAGTAA